MAAASAAAAAAAVSAVGAAAPRRGCSAAMLAAVAASEPCRPLAQQLPRQLRRPPALCRQLMAAPAQQLQRRWYTPPSRRTWSKQHHRIRSPRPMVDRFDLSREQPQKEWWRERRIAPATFFGFPDVTKIGLRGGSLYVEQMDAVTLAVLADKCLKEGVDDPEIWEKFCWRAQQLSTRTYEPDLCYIFRAFARKDWFDQNLLTTYLGRLHRRLHNFHLPDVAVLLEAFANPLFRQGSYLQKTLLHLVLLLQHRDDAKSADLARCCAALRPLIHPAPSAELRSEASEALELLAEALLLRDLSELSPSRAILVIDAFVAWGLMNPEGPAREASAAMDLCWALARELRGKLRGLGREKPDDLATLALALAEGGLAHEDLWQELTHNLEHEAHRLSGPAVCAAIFGATKARRCTGPLFENLARRGGETAHSVSATDCARAIGGFMRGPQAIAERAVLRGPIGDRTLELGLQAFSSSELAVVLDGLARTTPGAFGVEALAGATLEEIHGRLHGEQEDPLSAKVLCTVARSLSYLRPSSREVLVAILDRAQSALAEAAAEAATEAAAEAAAAAEEEEAQDLPMLTIGGGPSPRHLAMLCQGIAQQPPELLPDAAARLEALLPQAEAALAAEASPSAWTALTLLSSLVRCKASDQRTAALNAASARLAGGARELPVVSLVALSSALGAAAKASPPWTPPEELGLLRKVAELLDMKRYDLPRGALGRAAAALEAAGAGPEPLRLEERDR